MVVHSSMLIRQAIISTIKHSSFKFQYQPKYTRGVDTGLLELYRNHSALHCCCGVAIVAQQHHGPGLLACPGIVR